MNERQAKVLKEKVSCEITSLTSMRKRLRAIQDDNTKLFNNSLESAIDGVSSALDKLTLSLEYIAFEPEASIEPGDGDDEVPPTPGKD